MIYGFPLSLFTGNIELLLNSDNIQIPSPALFSFLVSICYHLKRKKRAYPEDTACAVQLLVDSSKALKVIDTNRMKQKRKGISVGI